MPAEEPPGGPPIDPTEPTNPPPSEEGAPTSPGAIPGGYAPPPGYAETPPPGVAPPPPYTPPPYTPPPGAPAGQPARGARGGGRGFLIGLAIGVIPLILAMIGLGGSFRYSPSTAYLGNFLIAGAIGLPIWLIISIVLSVVARTRQIGLGMLTAVVASPVVFFVGCLVLLSRPFG